MKHQKQLLLTITTCLFAALGPISPASAQTSDPLVNALVTKGILTVEEAKQIKAEVDASATNEPVKFVMPRGHESKMMLEGIIQANIEGGDVSSFEGKLANGPNQVYPRIRLRRARIGVIGEFLDNFDYRVEGDFQQSDGFSGSRTGFSGTDLFINYHGLPEANFKVGQFIVPFGYEMLLPDVGPNLMLLTAERSLVTVADVPERQIGIQLWGKPLERLFPEQRDLINYAVGVFNGNNRNITINDNSQFMYVGRVDLVPLLGTFCNQPIKWRFGANAYYTRDNTNTLLDQIGNLQLDPLDGSLVPLSTHNPDQRTAYGLDSTLTVGPFDLTGEYIQNRIRSTTPGLDFLPTTGVPPFLPQNVIQHGFTARGYYIQPSYYLLGKRLQLVGKWESFDPGQSANDTIKSFTGGINWYIYNQNIVAMLNYIHTWSDYRRLNPNAQGFEKDQFNELLLRLQLYF